MAVLEARARDAANVSVQYINECLRSFHLLHMHTCRCLGDRCGGGGGGVQYVGRGAQLGLGMTGRGNGSVRMSGETRGEKNGQRTDEAERRTEGKGRCPSGLLQVARPQLGPRGGVWDRVL